MPRGALRVLAVSGLMVLSSYVQPPAAAEPLLGAGHIWLKAGRNNLSRDAADAWGVDREGYLALEGFRACGRREWYAGGELGLTASDSAVDEDGDKIRNFRFWRLELNTKKAFDLTHGLSIDVGLGWSFFYVEGDELSAYGGTAVADPLADVGFGLQGFADFTWRMRHLLLGLDAKYQWAVDVIDVDYSNLRLGAHLGVAF